MAQVSGANPADSRPFETGAPPALRKATEATTLVLAGSVLVAGVASTARGESLLPPMAAAGLGVVLAFRKLDRKLRLSCNACALTAALLVFNHVFVGGWLRFYESYGWFDELAHFVGMASVAFMAAAILCQQTRGQLAKTVAVALIMSITLSLGSVWELVEFGLDQLAPYRNQTGLEDTMLDLLFGALGAASGLLLFSILLTTRDLERLRLPAPPSAGGGVRR